MLCSLAGSTNSVLYTQPNVKFIFLKNIQRFCLLASSAAFEKTDTIIMADVCFLPLGFLQSLQGFLFIPESLEYCHDVHPFN